MPSSVMWAEQLRIFPHIDWGVSVSYACFHPNFLIPWLSWALLAELLEQFQYYLPEKPLLFFLIQSVKKKKSHTKNFRVDLNIQIHSSWKSLKERKKFTMSVSYLSLKQWDKSQENNVEKKNYWLKQWRNLK